jgi:hypothetical protein
VVIVWNITFWIFFAVIIIIAGAVVSVRKLRFIDVQIIIMVAAIALSCDMLFCKQYSMYTYINAEHKGWYSFWANTFILPAWGLIFIKFVPKSIKGTTVYIAAWTLISTMFELFIAKPIGLVLYPRWRIIPYSPIGYTLVFTWVYVYYRLLLNHCK